MTDSFEEEMRRDLDNACTAFRQQLDEHKKTIGQFDRVLTESLRQRDSWKARALAAEAACRRMDPMQARNDSSELRSAGRLIADLRHLIWGTGRSRSSVEHVWGADRVGQVFERCTQFLKVRKWGTFGPDRS